MGRYEIRNAAKREACKLVSTTYNTARVVQGKSGFENVFV